MRIYISILFLICIQAFGFFQEVLASDYTIDKKKEVGDIPFQTNTTPMGALTYTVPIECFQNPKGLQPNISLVYNSMAGNGIAGMGWSISGLSSISRVNSSQYYDGEVKAATFSDDCAYALDGVRLVKKKGTDYFVTEQGNIIVKADFKIAHTQFDVFFPNGNKAIYKAIYKEDINGYIGIPNISYAISQMEDRYGNKIIYRYENVGDVPYIKHIYYASNTDGSSADISFSYKTIKTGVPSYFDGKVYTQPYLLEQITVEGHDKTENAYSFSLSYKYDEEKDTYYLEKINKKSISGNKEINPLVFTYGADKEEKLEVLNRTLVDYPTTVDSIVALIPVKFSAKEPTNGLIVMPEKSNFYFGKFISTNGLKIPGCSEYLSNDIAYVYNDITDTEKTPLEMNLGGTFFLDDELVPGRVLPIGGQLRGVHTIDYLGTGNNYVFKIVEKNRFDNDIDICTQRFVFWGGENNEVIDSLTIQIPEKHVMYDNKIKVISNISRTYLTGDFTGVGYESLLYITHHTDINDKKRSSTAVFVDFNQKEILYNKACFDVDPGDILCVIDFDGDGRGEIFHMNDDGIYVYKFDLISGFRRIVDWNIRYMLPSTNNTSHKPGRMYLFGDINGDGKTDFIQSPTSKELANDRNFWTYYFSNGNNGFERVTYGGPDYQNLEELVAFYPDNKYLLQDVDGNGLPDLVILDKEGTVSVYKNIKGKFSTEPIISPEKVDARSKLVLSRVREANKLYPIMGVKGENLSLISNSVNEQENSIMTSSFSSYGVETKHTYGTLTDKEICTVLDTASLSFPYNYIVEDIFVLKNTETYLNNKKISSVGYLYKNPVIHRQGLGFSGYEQITATDNLRDKTTKQTFDPTKFGVVTSVETPTLSVKSEYDTLFLGNKQVQVLLKKEVRNDILNGTSVTSTFVYDTYGNITDESVDYGDGIKTVTSRILDNINTPDKYLLGILKEETQTNIREGLSSSTKTDIIYNDLYLPDSKKNYYNNNLVSEEKYKYDSSNNLEQVRTRAYTSENWLATNYEYDGLGRVIKETDPLGLFTEYLYEGKNLLQSKKDHKGHETKYAYDVWGRNTSVSYPDGTVESTSLKWADSPAGAAIVSTSSATGQPDLQTYYDALGRELRTGEKRFDGTYLYTDKVYDELGRTQKTSLPFKGSNPTYWNTYEYDSYDRIKVLNYASGKKDIYTYGKLQTRSDIDGIATIKTYDASGEVMSIEDAAGTIIYKYRPDGQLTSIIAPGDIETSFEYDKYGRQTVIHDPSAGSKRFEFDAAGNINKETDARGKVTKIVYDSYNRLTTKEVVDELTTTYTYNDDGLLKSELSNNGTSVTYVYDELFRLNTQKETVADNKWLEKTYAYSGGNLSSVSYNSSQSGDITSQNYIYANGHNIEIKLHDGTSIWKLIGENNIGMPVSSTTGVLSRTYGYDNFGLPTSRVIKNGTIIIQDFSYNFDPQTGNLNWRKDNTRNLRERFSYDRLNRLTGFRDKKMSYDEKGNITYFPNVGQFKYNSPKPYALTTIAGCQQGDLDGLQNYRSGQIVTYTNMMRPLSINENNRITTFSYNGNGDRVKMLIQRGDTTELERYYIGGEYEIDKTVAGTEERLYLGGDAYSAAAVYVKQGTGVWQVQYIGRDYLGSITHVIDATGTVKQELSYDPWGRLRNPVTQALYDIDHRLALVLGGRGYTGHEHLINHGLINMNARLYDPVVGRFLSPDPYVQSPDFSQNFNRYSYALNNPLRYTDPNGEFVWIPFVVAALIGGGLNWWAHGANFDMAGLKYFGIGMGVGVAGYVTGGAAFTALAGAGAAVGTGGAIAGAGAGLIGFFGASTVSMLGNNVLMGDPMPTGGEMAMGMGISMATGGLMNGTMAAVNGNNFWNGAPRAFGRSAFAFNNTPRVSRIPAPAKIEPLGKQLLNAPRANTPNIPSNSAKIEYRIDYTPKTTNYPSSDGGLTLTRPVVKGYDLRVFGDTPSDLNHNFPMHYDEIILKHGSMANVLKNGNYWFELPGSINNTNGIYQIGMGKDGIIYHRGFIDLGRYLKK